MTMGGAEAFRPGPKSSPSRDLSAQIARRERRLRSIMELSRELMTMKDLFGTIDLLLFSLMGQFGSARSALWLRSEDHSSAVLVRAHGTTRAALAGTTPELGPIVTLLREHPYPIPIDGDADLPVALRQPLERAGIALIAPLLGQGEVIGMFALGCRVSDQAFDAEEIETLSSALGILGIAVQNTLLFHRQADLNRQLQRMNAHLVELDRMKSEFVANVNHELRTPLAVVIGSLQCLKDPSLDPSRGRTFVEGALGKAQELSTIVERLLMFSQLSGRRRASEVRPGDVAQALASYHEQRVPGIHAGLREFVLVCDPLLPRAWFDLPALHQILDELTNNSIKFTPHGSRLELRASAETRDERPWVVVRLSDNGPGIPRERLDSLFREFEQADGSSTRAVGGLGLGLPLARRLAGTMGARLDVDPDAVAGASFVILLPAV